MIGRKVEKLLDDGMPDNRVIDPEKIAVSLRNYRVDMPGEQVKGIDLDIRKGEIFGIGGLVGSQRSELMEAIFGLRQIEDGKIYIKGKEVHIRRPFDAVRNKMALLTEDRRKTGNIGPASITDNTLVVEQNVNPRR